MSLIWTRAHRQVWAVRFGHQRLVWMHQIRSARYEYVLRQIAGNISSFASCAAGRPRKAESGVDEGVRCKVWDAVAGRQCRTAQHDHRPSSASAGGCTLRTASRSATLSAARRFCRHDHASEHASAPCVDGVTRLAGNAGESARESCQLMGRHAVMSDHSSSTLTPDEAQGKAQGGSVTASAPQPMLLQKNLQ